MKVNIVTSNNSYNYGAALQAYALQQKVKSLGVKCQFIDERPILKRKVIAPKGLKGLLLTPFYYLNKKELEKGYRAFEKFVNEYQELTEERYVNYSSLKNNPTDADIFITGSDQVWNTISCRPINFLEFVPKGKKKISYAASMGIDYIVEEKKEIVREYLKDFSSISVREEDAAVALKEVTDKEIQVNIDPVFLLSENEWRNVQTTDLKITKPYILCYILYRPKWLNEKLKKLHREIKKDIVVVDLSLYRNIYKNKIVRSAGPRELLELIDKADGVITSSFHGTALSIVYHKIFYSIINPKFSSRISNILTKLGLEERVLNEDSIIDFEKKIDYSFADGVIKEEQKKSTDYLKRNIMEEFI